MPAIPFILRVLLQRRRLERSCRWSRLRLLEHQQTALSELRNFAFAYRHSPFYRAFHHGFETQPFTELPILTKAALRENFDTLVTDRGVRLSEVEAFLRSGNPSQLYRDKYVVLSTSGRVPRIRVSSTGELKRGATGKAPLIAAVTR